MFVSVPNTLMNHIMETTDTLTLTLTPHSGNTLAEKGMKKEQNHSNASRSSIKMALKSTTAGGNGTNPRDQSSAENADISSNDTTSDESDDELEALVMDDEDESLSHAYLCVQHGFLVEASVKSTCFRQTWKTTRKNTTQKNQSNDSVA